MSTNLQTFHSPERVGGDHENQCLPCEASKLAREGNGSNHTPGPWFAVKDTAGSWGVRISPARYAQEVAYVSGGCPEYYRGDPEANARLIAAAPAMIDALRKIASLSNPAENDSVRSDAMWHIANIAQSTLAGKDPT